MATYTGLLLRLKDKKTCMTDKLKLAKFSWVTESVLIPNKHQQILDFVCGLLVNRKKHNITDEDVVLVWETLNRFLYLAGTGFVVKPSILQAVVDGLRMYTMKMTPQKQTELMLHILRSAQKLLVLQSVTAFQFENLCTLLSMICQLLMTSTPHSELRTELQLVLEALLSVLIKNQKSHLNQVQVLNFVTDKVLTVAIKMLDTLPSLKLQEFLLECLLHRDHQDLYAAYLKHTFGEPVHGHIKQAPKSVGNVFTSLSVQLAEIESSALLRFIPEFMNMFICQHKSEPRLCYLLLKHLVNMVIPPEDTAARIGSCDKWRLEVVARCVMTCQDCDLFIAGNETNDIMKWFFELTKLMLDRERAPAWFSYLRGVLNLNHHVIEKFWLKILNLGFVNADQISDDCFAEQDHFLADLVSTYIKLRRTPDLLSAILSSVETSAMGTDVYCHLPKFYDRLCHMFSEAPLGSLLDMLENLQAMAVKMVELLSVQSKDSARAYTCLHWVFSFYTVLLGNSRLFNHWGIGMLGQRVVALMKQLEEHILFTLNRKKEIAAHCPSWKGLLSTWAVVKILSFPRWRESANISTTGINGKMEEDIEILSQKLDSVSKLRLVVQRQNLASVTNPDSIESQKKQQTAVENIVKDFLDMPQLSKESVFKVWEDQNNGPTVLKQPAHQFQQFSQMFPLVGKSLSGDIIDKLVDVVVKVLSHASMEDMNRTHSNGTTLFTEVEHFLAHPATKEVKMVQERLSMAIWKSLLSGLGSSMLSPQKKKLKLETDTDGPSLAKVFNFLTASEFQAEKCMLDLSQINGDLQVLPHFAVMIKVLTKLDLEYLQDTSLLCQIGACIFIASLSRSESNEELKNCVIELLIRCLSIPNLSRLFECVKPTGLLDLVFRVYSQGSATDSKLLNITVQAVMNDYEAVPSMVVYAKKLTGDLCNTFEAESIIKMKTVALIIKNCQRYVTKSFHISRIRQIAHDIFFCLAKFVIKRGLEWFEKVKLAQVHTRSSETVFEKAPKAKNRKRKLTEKSIQPHNPDEQEFASLLTAEDSCTTAWCALLECLSEILHLWSKDIVDNKFNEHLDVIVGKVIKQAMEDLQSDLVSSMVKVSELKFISACCHCHLQCNQAFTVDSSALTSSPLSPHPDRSSSLSSSETLCLLPGRKLEEIWASCLSQCVSELSRQLGLPRCSEACLGSVSLPPQALHTDPASTKLPAETGSISGQTGGMLHRKTKQIKNISTQNFCSLGKNSMVSCIVGLNQPSMEHNDMRLDRIETWPVYVVARVDVLTSVMECSDVSMFRCILIKMMESLVPASEVDVSTVMIMMAVWRRLIKSQLLSDNHIQEMFGCMYQFLSVISSLVQYHEKLKTPCHSSPSSESPSLPELTPSMHDASRAVVEALSEFVDLGKTLITPRMTLLCLNAGLTFTLTCPSDLEALYRLINTLLIHHTNTALTAVSTIVHIANKLISSCIELGDEERLTKRPDLVPDLLRCAQLITRLLTLLSSTAYKTDLSKVAHSILAAYVIGVQGGSLHTSVKRELVRGQYKVMSMCDKYRLGALNSALPAGVKDTFKVLHQDYEKYHRYSGFV